MASFRLAHSFARRPLGRPLQSCAGNPPKNAGKASFGSGRVDRSLYGNLRSAMADYLAEDMTSTTPPGPHKFDEPVPTVRRVVSKRGARAPRESPAGEVSKGRPPRTIHEFRPSRTSFGGAPHRPFDRTSRNPFDPAAAPETDTSTTEKIAPLSTFDTRFSAARLFGIPRSKGPDQPLRILFCGSDEFSCVSLKALYSEFFRSRKMIKSIDVVVRPAKPAGRGLKEMREVPLKKLAQILGLPIHERDTFTGWDLPKYKPEHPLGFSDPRQAPDGTIDLIIAVSFGLFVPPRLLDAARYGGLNVHPSLLPDFRGPAPIHHTLLNTDTRYKTGVTLQTLSPHTFDAGVLLAQTQPPGFTIPLNATVPQLTAALATEGANMLMAGLRYGVYMPPHLPFVPQTPYGAQDRMYQRDLLYAPKITGADREVVWHTTWPGRITRQARVFGKVWTKMVVPQEKPGAGTPKRVVLQGMTPRQLADGEDRNSLWRGATFAETAAGGLKRVRIEYLEKEGGSVLLRGEGWGWVVEVDTLTVDGAAARPAATVMNWFWDGSAVKKKVWDGPVVGKGKKASGGSEDAPQKTPKPEVTAETPEEAARTAEKEKEFVQSLKSSMFRL